MSGSQRFVMVISILNIIGGALVIIVGIARSIKNRGREMKAARLAEERRVAEEAHAENTHLVEEAKAGAARAAAEAAPTADEQ